MATDKSMKLTKLNMIHIGGAAFMVIGSALAIAQAMQPKPQTPTCEQRYAGGILFSLARSEGSPLAPEDIQARLGGLDWGLTRNTRVVKEAAVPFGHALEIDFKRTARADESEQNRGGMGFTWLPRQLAAASAACLSYSFWMPADFKTGEGGTMPGLISEKPQESGNDSEPAGQDQNGSNADQGNAQRKAKPFSTRPYWRQDNRIVLNSIVNTGQPIVSVPDAQKSRLKPGQWTRIEQEVVLNTPGRNDGVMRVWIDRQLVVERFDIGFRNTDVQSFQGVSGDTHFTRGTAWMQPPSDTKMRLSPLELRFK